MTGSADPVAEGLVASMARPGGNITGSSLMIAELGSKRLELLKEAVPRVAPPRPWGPAHFATLCRKDLALARYSMTWSACSRSVLGIVSVSAFAVLRLMTSSNFAGSSIGKSPGLAPFRTSSTYRAARRNESFRLGA